MIEVNNISKTYNSLTVLNDVSLKIAKGEIISIVGSSGAGKSTLLHIMGTLLKQDTGKILFNHQDISDFSEKKLAAFRNKHIGFIFQFHHLLPEFTAIENVCIPAMIGGTSFSDNKKRAEELLDFLGLKDRKNHKPSELSGGEQQRVAVARALMNNPDVIFADEPSGNLDTHNAKELHQLFFDLREKMNQTVVIVTHNESLAEMSDRKIVMKDGRIVS